MLWGSQWSGKNPEKLEKWVFFQKVKENLEKSGKIGKKRAKSGKSLRNFLTRTVFFSLAKLESLSLRFLKIIFLIKKISVYLLLCVVLVKNE